jgi:hypothetical protein
VYQQRAEPRTTDLVGLWEPEILRTDEKVIEFAPEPEDMYVVLDELISDQVRLAVSPWPDVDEAGRLRFSGSGSEPVGFGRDELQTELDLRRESEGQQPRPLRIGDVLMVRGFGEKTEGWDRVLDVTAPARKAASRAGLRAVAQVDESAAGPVGAEPENTDAEASEPIWRRAPVQPTPTPAARPPAEASPGSVSNAAV